MELKNFNVTLTETDRMILLSYKATLESLAAYLGSCFEIVLHSLEDCEHSAITVINGQHTGRHEGSPITNLALSMLEEIQGQKKEPTGITYFSKNPGGEPLRSTTIPIVGEKKNIIGLICINFYLNSPFNEILSSFIPPEGINNTASENYNEDPDTILDYHIHKIKAEVFSNNSISEDNKRKEIIRRLNEKNLFTYKGSVKKAADILCISENTVYLHLRNLKG